MPLASLGPVDRKTFYEIEMTAAFQAGPGIYTLALASTSSNGATYSSRQHPSPAQSKHGGGETPRGQHGDDDRENG